MRTIRNLSHGVLAASCAALAVAGFTAGAASATPAASPQEFSKAARTTKAADPWAWSASARAWASRNGVIPAAVIKRGPTAKLTRDQWLVALLKVEQLRGTGGGGNDWDVETEATYGLMERAEPAPALVDAAAGTARARAVAYGWMTARSGAFRGRSAVTANEAALSAAGVLGLRPSVVSLTLRLRSEVPGARVSTYSAAHALVRTLGMRWNVKDPNDELELGPNEAVNVAHGAYMLQVAATGVRDWDLDEAERLATTFDLPALGPNQRRILRTAVRQLGQPYVWAGETEGSQPEGHPGFDCSGFTIRVINKSGVPAAQIAQIRERTTYTQSAIPRSRRITRAKLQPGDAMFFGNRGPRSTPAQNYHAGVYMGNGWFIHSSGGNGGVAIDNLDGWWAGQFAWGRRALRTR
jgi:cell wall-associated NlpC family hydrolase